MSLIGLILFRILQIFLWLMMARAIMSWIPMLAPNFTPKGIVLVLFELIYTLTDPPMKLARRIPPLNLGGIGLDMGFLAVVVAVIVLQRVVLTVFF